jgi:hypothetical protein
MNRVRKLSRTVQTEGASTTGSTYLISKELMNMGVIHAGIPFFLVTHQN